MTRAAATFALLALLAGGALASTPLQLDRAVVGGETIAMPAAEVAPVVWSFAGQEPAWTAGAGISGVNYGAALTITTRGGTADLVSPALGVSASAYGTLRIRFAATPAPVTKDAIVWWTRADGATRSQAFELRVTNNTADLDLGSSFAWYGRIERLTLRLPATVAAAPYVLAGIDLVPRTSPYLVRERVVIDEYALRDQISPFEARDGSFVPPDSTLDFSAAPGASELRFGLGITRQKEGGWLGDGGDGDGTTASLDVEARDGERVVASRHIPVLLGRPGWFDFAMPLPASPRPLRVRFRYADKSASTVAFLAKPRANVADAKPQLALLTTVDALRKSNLSAYGYTRPTPGFDRIARDGVLFTRAYAQSNNTPMCVLSLLTSQYQTKAPGDAPSLARFLGERGYVTVMLVANAALQEPVIAKGFDIVEHVLATKHDSSADLEDELVRVLRRHRGENVFVYAHFLDPHAPYAPARHTAGTYASPADDTTGRTFEPWLYGNVRQQPGLNHSPAVPLSSITPAERQTEMDLYDEEVLDVSLHLEDLWSTMQSLGLYDDATIVLSADHGEEFFENGGVQHGGEGLYDVVTTVPLLVKLPRSSRAGARIDTLVEHVDVYPTIVRTLGLQPPAGIAGENLFDVHRGYAISQWHLYGTPWYREAVRDDTWKLILGHRDNGPDDPTLLFRIADDPHERRNVAGEHADVVARLRALLAVTR